MTEPRNSREAREKLAEVQQTVEKAFEEAKTDDGSLDLSKIKSLPGCDTPSKAAEVIRQKNEEMDDLGRKAEAFEQAEGVYDQMQETAHNFKHPDPSGSGGPKGQQEAEAKDIGSRIVGSKRYKEWASSGAAGGQTFQFSDVYPSDWLAKGGTFDTLQQKTLFETTAGWAPESLRIGQMVEATTRPIQLLDIIPMQRTSSEQVVYMEETTRTHAAAETSEGGTFPEATFDLTEKTSSVRKIATSIPVTDEQLEDVAQAQSYLNNRLTFGLRQRLDNQVLLGNGTAPNLTGLSNVSGINSQAKGTDPIPDAIHKAMRQTRVTGRAQPTHILMHPQDWEKLRLLRTSDGMYIWGNPSESGPERVWGIPVVQTDASSQGTAWVISAQPQWMAIYERRGIDVQVGFTGTQFTEGKRTIRGDMRAAFVVFRPSTITEITGL